MLYGVAAKSGSRVKSFSASADLTMAVSCLFDSTVECWDIVSGRVVWVIQRAGQMTGHESAVNDVQMSADGQLIVTASKDCTARIWNTSSRQCKHVLVGHEDSVIGMVVEQASRTLVTYSLDHSLIVWDLDSGKRISRAKFKSPISRIAMSINGRIAVALSNACINLIDLHSGDIQEVPSLHNGDITDLAFSKDGNYLISSSWDCSIKVIDLTRGCVRGIAMLDSPITCFALDNMHLVAGMDRGTVAFIDVGGIMQGDGN
jgi:WD40 repeat protein